MTKRIPIADRMLRPANERQLETFYYVQSDDGEYMVMAGKYDCNYCFIKTKDLGYAVRFDNLEDAETAQATVWNPNNYNTVIIEEDVETVVFRCKVEGSTKYNEGNNSND